MAKLLPTADFQPQRFVSQLTAAERLALSDLAMRLSMARALALTGDAESAARRLGADLQTFLHLHRVTGLAPEKAGEAREFLIEQAQQFLSACAQHPAADDGGSSSKL